MKLPTKGIWFFWHNLRILSCITCESGRKYNWNALVLHDASYCCIIAARCSSLGWLLLWRRGCLCHINGLCPNDWGPIAPSQFSTELNQVSCRQLFYGNCTLHHFKINSFNLELEFKPEPPILSWVLAEGFHLGAPLPNVSPFSPVHHQ